MLALGSSSVVGGGSGNGAYDEMTTVAGGQDNEAGTSDPDGTNASHATVRRRRGETQANGHASTIPWRSDDNIADGSYAFAAGWQAEAAHDGTFVWADSTDAPFSSTDYNQFLIRSSGGVGIGTNAPLAQLHVSETTTRSAMYVAGSYGGGIPGATMRVFNTSSASGVSGYFESAGTDGTIVVKNTSTGSLLKAYTGGDLRFHVDNGGNVWADGIFHPSGADLAESFDVEGDAADFEPGDVLFVSDDSDYSVELVGRTLLDTDRGGLCYPPRGFAGAGVHGGQHE